MRRGLFFLIPILHAQAPIENNGAPMRVPFTCASESMQTAGLACSEEDPCSVYLELSGVEAVGNKIFLAGNLHSATITLDSILLASDDAGKTWTEPDKRSHFSALDQIQFIDFETGWISGHMVQGIPRDPFFLITSDGGKTWRQSPVFEDGRAGAVEHFWFESRTRGRMLLATGLRKRHELYESMTGGESWGLQQVSDKPIPWRGAGSAEHAEQQAWRIRADAKTHSFQIEKRHIERWQPVASFLVDAGRCTQ